MRISIMQPYFLPYIGYWQLIASVDKFVILDDVSYINRGWINRNRYYDGSKAAWMTIPLNQASQNRLINDLAILDDNGWKAKILQSVVSNYKAALKSDETSACFTKWITNAVGNLSDFLHMTICEISAICGSTTEIVRTSSIYPKDDLRGQARILDICLRENATVYVNPPGGADLYSAKLFSDAGVELRFLKPELANLDIQHGGTEGPTLSILDLLFHNEPAKIKSAANTFSFSYPSANSD